MRTGKLYRLANDFCISVEISYAFLRLAGLLINLGGTVFDRPRKFKALHWLAIGRLESAGVFQMDNALWPLPLDRRHLWRRTLNRLAVDMLERPVRIALANFLLANRMNVGFAEVKE